MELPGGGFGLVHTLPVVGCYLYTPKWPAENQKSKIKNQKALLESIASEAHVGWIRIEPETEELLAELQQVFGSRLVKAPHDMQPRENLIIDITKSEDELLAEMKPKTRYNVRLAEKHGVRIFTTNEEKYQKTFLDLIQATAKRQGILTHPKSYYQQFLAVFPRESYALFVAEYAGEVLAANTVIFSGDTAVYLHGGTSDAHREVMAPFRLQWEQMRAAKGRGCTQYDFGGVSTNSKLKTRNSKLNSWAGITRFKIGFSPATPTTLSPGSYDIIINSWRYRIYRVVRPLQIGVNSLQKLSR